MPQPAHAPTLEAVRDHYDGLSRLYLRLWGEHIHHGCFEPGDSPARAQLRLIETLAQRARVPRNGLVLDVGCGLGGSARWLAEHHACTVRAITISPAQARLARRLTPRRLRDRIEYAVVDANRLDGPPAAFDLVWVIECSEHLARRAAFLRACARLLRPGGRLALCAWLRPDQPREPAGEALLNDICRAMLCPALGSQRDYLGWMTSAGLDPEAADDLSAHVAPTWDRCASIARRPMVRLLLRLHPAPVRAFVRSFAAMQRAFAEGALRYGLFVARKPGPAVGSPA